MYDFRTFECVAHLIFNQGSDEILKRGEPSRAVGHVVPGGYSDPASSLRSGGIFIVLAGPAGVGKTDALRGLAELGEQVLDLEELACHRGSAFGGIGLGPQPSHQSFQCLVRDAVASTDPERPIWVEDEGPFLGSVGVPPWLQDALARAPVVELIDARERRIDRLVASYGADRLALLAAIARSARRLGTSRAARASRLVRADDLCGAADELLGFFDPAYARRAAARPRAVLGTVEGGDRERLRALGSLLRR